MITYKSLYKTLQKIETVGGKRNEIPKEWEFIVGDSIGCAIMANQKDNAEYLEAEKAGDAFFETLLQQTGDMDKNSFYSLKKIAVSSRGGTTYGLMSRECRTASLYCVIYIC